MEGHAGGRLGASLKPRERIISSGLEKLAIGLSCGGSYRRAADILNEALHRTADVSISARTLADHVHAQGKALSGAQEDMARKTFESSGMSWDSALPMMQGVLPGNVALPDDKAGSIENPRARALIAGYNSDRRRREQINADEHAPKVELRPDDCVYVSIDDVGVKHQKDHRKGKAEKAAYVENTVVHVQNAGRTYLITAVGMFEAIRLLLAFLLRNGLLNGKRLFFFSDGAKNIRAALERHFSFYPYELFLDWYHLEKKMTELLSMALKGEKNTRHGIRAELAGILWAGNTGEAMQYLKDIAPANVKNAERLNEAIDYLERKTPYICCYALRAMLDYRNSSNPGEKANDLIVARSQKHNGMSWSQKGSGALALLSALVKNGEAESWIKERRIAFEFSKAS